MLYQHRSLLPHQLRCQRHCLQQALLAAKDAVYCRDLKHHMQGRHNAAAAADFGNCVSFPA